MNDKTEYRHTYRLTRRKRVIDSQKRALSKTLNIDNKRERKRHGNKKEIEDVVVKSDRQAERDTQCNIHMNRQQEIGKERERGKEEEKEKERQKD